MFERFTESAIKVIMIAQEESRRLGHDSVGTEQILVALVLEHTGIAAKALKAAGLSTTKVRMEVEKIIGRGSGFCPVEMSLTPRAKEVIARAYLKSTELGEHRIETEHLLLALLDEEQGFGIQAMENSNIDRIALKDDVLNLREKRNRLRDAEPFNFRQGDVVLVQLEGMGDGGRVNAKRRPMIVIGSNQCVSRLSTITVVPLTSNPREKVADVLDVLITAASPAGKAAGLRQDCLAACTFVYTYPKDWVVGKIGTLPQDVVDEICGRVAKLIEPSM